jgi:hypothetical protein
VAFHSASIPLLYLSLSLSFLWSLGGPRKGKGEREEKEWRVKERETRKAIPCTLGSWNSLSSVKPRVQGLASTGLGIAYPQPSIGG